MQAEANIKTLNEAGAKKVIASCPHCLHTLRNDYPQFGGEFEVIHHTQLLSHLMEQELIKPIASPESLGKVTYHDSCYLGRWNGEFDAPRAVLEGATNVKELTEMPRNKRYGFCCGAGGGRMFMEEDGPRINENRSEEIIASGADTVAVACPFCSIMLTDGMKAKDKYEDVAVLDIAEILASTLPDVPLSKLRKGKADNASSDA
jgi:Fe-S oxidoreductase